ncbi:hypothetical protein DFH08DRAFT_1029764 [Mycena albidolilacea]|uniref:Uncharacterized protein n=1 Tax=Mycena albidolilacea TaxID=1033008 RepID=A0AAD7EHN9_9AGAR|nr:hypothetical protein DFH08DRAFT_1029764 [Mycena albidolilacea]
MSLAHDTPGYEDVVLECLIAGLEILLDVALTPTCTPIPSLLFAVLLPRCRLLSVAITVSTWTTLSSTDTTSGCLRAAITVSTGSYLPDVVEALAKRWWNHSSFKTSAGACGRAIATQVHPRNEDTIIAAQQPVKPMHASSTRRKAGAPKRASAVLSPTSPGGADITIPEDESVNPFAGGNAASTSVGTGVRRGTSPITMPNCRIKSREGVSRGK